MCPCLPCFNTLWWAFFPRFLSCPSSTVHLEWQELLCDWQGLSLVSKWRNGKSAANLSWAQTNPGNLSSHSSIPGSKICIRCSLWSYIGKLCPEIISLSNWTIMKLWTTSWWLLWTKKFWKVLCWFIATTGWMSLQQGKYRSVLKYSILCWKHKAGRNNGILVTCDPNLPYKIVKLFTLAVSS